jgi:DNA-binding CsgD family transcriptional regulator
MKPLLPFLLAFVLATLPSLAYNDHRGHNLDSLERAVAVWTPDAVDKASEQELVQLNRAYRDLMMGYQVLNQEKFQFYARKALQISRRQGWNSANADALRHLGEYFYAHDQYDSALVCFNGALRCTDLMEAGSTSPTHPDGYTEREIDDTRSALYGAIGNLYNMMDSIPRAMDYYEKAGRIFEKYGWNESNSILHYNMGETWVDEKDFRKAGKEYDKALEYAQASGDSLMIVNVWKGYGRLYAEQGRNRKSLKFLRKADAYYAAHPDYSPGFRTENLDYMKEVLSRQKRQLGRLAGGLTGAILVALGFFFRKRKKAAPAQAGSATETPPGIDWESLDLSEREKEILDLLSKGYTTPQMAQAQNLSPETIKWYRKKLLVKFDVANSAELVNKAKEMGLI